MIISLLMLAYLMFIVFYVGYRIREFNANDAFVVITMLGFFFLFSMWMIGDVLNPNGFWTTEWGQWLHG